MRKDESAELMIYCPTCGNSVNEYNWTLAQAARYADEYTQTPTFISILLKIATDPNYNYENERFMCPRCNERIKLKLVPVPPLEELLAYVEKVGEEYVNALF